MKKVVSLVLAAMLLLCVASVSLAEASIALNAIVRVTNPTAGGSWTVELTEEEQREEWLSDEMAGVAAYLGEGNTIVSYFEESVQAQAVPADIDKDSLVCFEIEGVYAIGYLPEYGDNDIEFIFPSVFEQGQFVTVVFGEEPEEDKPVHYIWLDSYVNEEGNLVVRMTQEFLEDITNLENQQLMIVMAEPLN